MKKDHGLNLEDYDPYGTERVPMYESDEGWYPALNLHLDADNGNPRSGLLLDPNATGPDQWENWQRWIYSAMLQTCEHPRTVSGEPWALESLECDEFELSENDLVYGQVDATPRWVNGMFYDILEVRDGSLHAKPGKERLGSLVATHMAQPWTEVEHEITDLGITKKRSPKDYGKLTKRQKANFRLNTGIMNTEAPLVMEKVDEPDNAWGSIPMYETRFVTQPEKFGGYCDGRYQTVERKYWEYLNDTCRQYYNLMSIREDFLAAPYEEGQKMLADMNAELSE